MKEGKHRGWIKRNCSVPRPPAPPPTRLVNDSVRPSIKRSEDKPCMKNVISTLWGFVLLSLYIVFVSPFKGKPQGALQ